MNFKLIFIVTLIGLIVLFVVQNVGTVEIQFLFWSVTTSRSILIICVLAIGILIGWVLHGYTVYKEKNRIGRHSAPGKLRDLNLKR